MDLYSIPHQPTSTSALVLRATKHRYFVAGVVFAANGDKVCFRRTVYRCQHNQFRISMPSPTVVSSIDEPPTSHARPKCSSIAADENISPIPIPSVSSSRKKSCRSTVNRLFTPASNSRTLPNHSAGKNVIPAILRPKSHATRTFTLSNPQPSRPLSASSFPNSASRSNSHISPSNAKHPPFGSSSLSNVHTLVSNPYLHLAHPRPALKPPSLKTSALVPTIVSSASTSNRLSSSRRSPPITRTRAAAIQKDRRQRE